METKEPRSRVLVGSQIAYFLFLFLWLVVAATATQLSIEPLVIRAIFLAWFATYPLMWLGSLLMTHRSYSRGQPENAACWNLVPLAWIVPTVLIGIVSAFL